MTNIHDNITGFALLCDDEGKLKKILKDDFRITADKKTGTLFTNIVDRESRPKAMNFLRDIKEDKAAFNYQMNIWYNDELNTFSFIGIQTKEEEIIIISAGNQEDAIEFTNQLQQINNEQANTIRRLMKEKIQYENRIENDREQSFDDLTKLNNELINLQRELAKKNAELERLNETKNRFLGMAAHDLRSPLAIIQSYTEYLIEKSAANLPEKHLKFLSTIYSTSDFMLNLIEDLLDVTKIESGKLELNEETINLTQFAKSYVELNKPLANKKEIDISLDYNKENITITADRHKIEQVFNNLLNNAIKFSYPKGTITIHITQVTKNKHVQVSINDQGVGIKKEKLDKIFQPFQKISSQGTSGEKGTGLGLLIVKRIIEGHGGKIWVDSEEGKGTTFYFTMPAKEEKTTTRPDKRKNETKTYQWQNKNILVIEDDKISLKFIEEILEPTGINILSARNGNEGLQLYKENPAINLLLIDLSLPDMNGLEVIQNIRQDNDKLPIIIQTAHAMSGDKEKALDYGANDYLTKPLEKTTLLNLLNGYLNK
jgi:signal transduction histidine kinase